MSGIERPDVKSEYYIDPDTGQRHVVTKPGGEVLPSGKEGGILVLVSNGGLSRNREMATVTTRQKVTWADLFQPEQSVVITLEGTGALEAFVCFDAPNDAVADSWLADAGSTSTDAMRHYLATETLKPEGNKFTLPGVGLSRLDIKQLSGTIDKIYIEAE